MAAQKTGAQSIVYSIATAGATLLAQGDLYRVGVGAVLMLCAGLMRLQIVKLESAQ